MTRSQADQDRNVLLVPHRDHFDWYRIEPPSLRRRVATAALQLAVFVFVIAVVVALFVVTSPVAP